MSGCDGKPPNQAPPPPAVGVITTVAQHAQDRQRAPANRNLIVPRILQRVIDDGLLQGQVAYLARAALLLLACLLALLGPAPVRMRFRALGDMSNPSNAERIYLWRAALQQIADRPLVGWGPAVPDLLAAAVAVEVACLPLAYGSWRTALVSSLGNAALLAVRIPAEERALELRPIPSKTITFSFHDLHNSTLLS